MAVAARAYEQRERASKDDRYRRDARRRARFATKYRMRIAALSAAPLLLVFGYVGMTAELTAQTYRLSADRAYQVELRQTADTLGQRLAQTQSLTQLERVAQELHMAAPVDVVYIPVRVAARPKSESTTFAARFQNITRWLHVR